MTRPFLFVYLTILYYMLVLEGWLASNQRRLDMMRIYAIVT